MKYYQIKKSASLTFVTNTGLPLWNETAVRVFTMNETWLVDEFVCKCGKLKMVFAHKMGLHFTVHSDQVEVLDQRPASNHVAA